ncbi:hypothetical protein ACFW5I_02135 [Streptomyces sp. NPDC058818]|uniref:hypothetical protein n=1 Tax=Streptomyces sp. NPDC058818 TaxID=3346640 RepID=UPI00368F5234
MDSCAPGSRSVHRLLLLEVRREPDAVILVDGVSEGGIGIHGKAMGSLDLTELVSRPYRDDAGSRPAPRPPQGGWSTPSAA